MSATSLQGHILTPAGFVHGSLHMGADGRIAAVTGEPVSEVQVREGSAPIVLPGFIDLHVHGGAGHDIMEGGDAAWHVARLHAQHGTTSLLATTMTAPQSDLDAAFAALAPLCTAPARDAARVLGVHLEGPYISEARLGAQPPFARPASLGEIHRLHALAPIRLITLAPEVGGNDALIAQLVAEGFKVQLGHTTGSYEQGVARCAAGPPALPICSTPCRRCTTASPAWWVRRWRMPSLQRLFPTCCMCTPALFMRRCALSPSCIA